MDQTWEESVRDKSDLTTKIDVLMQRNLINF